jgi:DNA-binding NtrC family response regulator
MARATILIVDDEPDIREILAFELEDAGYEVVAAACGEAAIELAQLRSFALALVDMRMPGIDGLQTLAGLKALHPNLPVVIATGCASREMEEKSIGHGAFDCLWKPFDLDELTSIVQRAIRAGPQASPLQVD